MKSTPCLGVETVATNRSLLFCPCSSFERHTSPLLDFVCVLLARFLRCFACPLGVSVSSWSYLAALRAGHFSLSLFLLPLLPLRNSRWTAPCFTWMRTLPSNLASLFLISLSLFCVLMAFVGTQPCSVLVDTYALL